MTRRTNLHYRVAEIPAKGTAYLVPTVESAISLTRAKSYKVLRVTADTGPFVASLRWKSPFQEFKVDLSRPEKSFEVATVARPVTDAVEFVVENTSDEAQAFEAFLEVELESLKSVVETMADDMVEDLPGPSGDTFVHDGPTRVDGPSPFSQATPAWLKDTFGLGGPDLPDLGGPSFAKTIKSRITSIVDNVLRAVEVVVRDAADKLDQDDDEREPVIPIVRPSTAREFTLGFNTAHGEDVAPGASAIVITRPQILFKMKRVIIPDDVANAFDITDIRVGRNSQFATIDPVPAATFAASKGGEVFQTDVCQVSMNFAFHVYNRSDKPMRFSAAGVGVTIEESYDHDDHRADAIKRSAARAARIAVRRMRRVPSFLS